MADLDGHVWTSQQINHDRIGGFHINSAVLTVNYVPEHSHDFEELVCILDGRGEQTINGKSFEIKTGDVFVIQGQDRHGFANLDHVHIVNLGYQRRYLEQMEDMFLTIPGFSPMFYVAPRHRNLLAFESRLNLKPMELSNLSLMIDQFKQEFARKRAFSEAMLQVCFYQIVVFLADQYSQEPSDAPRGRFLALAPVLRYIEVQYMHPITLDELTKQAGMSTNQFLRAFNDIVQTWPIDYVIRVRIQKACELLERGDQTITDIAYDVGFRDSNYFSRIFKKITGCAPGEYRKKVKSC